MPINLKGAQTAVEKLLLVDNCQLLKGEDRTEDLDTWDPTTGNYVPGAAQVLYAGACQVTVTAHQAREARQGGVAAAETDYVVKISKDAVLADELQPEDLVKITSIHAGGDALLVGKVLTVKSVAMATFTVLRSIGCNLYVPRPNG